MTTKILATLSSVCISLSSVILLGQANTEVQDSISWADVVDKVGVPAALIFAFLGGAFYFTRMIVKELIAERLISHAAKYFETHAILSEEIIEELRANRQERLNANEHHRDLLDKYMEITHKNKNEHE